MFTLAIDIGGTGLKASVLDRNGRMTAKKVRVPTPKSCTPKRLLAALTGLVADLPAFDRISVGFPGMVRDGKVLTAPNLGTKAWRNFPLEKAIAEQFGKPARLLNDAEVQGHGIVRGRGLEVVLTLGTGIGCAVFKDGVLTPHLELGQHPVHDNATYDQYLGNAAFARKGKKKWNRRLHRTLGTVSTLLNYDRLYLGGGNAKKVTFVLPKNVIIASNEAGITGGSHLWETRK